MVDRRASVAVTVTVTVERQSIKADDSSTDIG